MSFSSIDIDRWIDEVDGAKPWQQSTSYNMGPKKMEERKQHNTRSSKKRSADQASISEGSPRTQPSRPPTHKKPRSAPATSTSSSTQPSAALNLINLQSAGICLIPLTADTLPEDARPLYSSVQGISQGFKTIPKPVRAHLSRGPEPILDHQCLDEYHLADDAAVQEFEQLSHVVDKAVRCQIEGVHEAEWNCSVQSPLFDIAFKTLATPKKVRVWNVTSVPILPNYLPYNLQTGDRLQSHKVDYCLTIEPDEAMREFTARQELGIINQTLYYPLARRPIAVTIETKSETPNSTGRPQLSTWVYAWLARVTEIAPVSTIPALPLLRVVGQDWSVLWAWRVKDDPLHVTITSDLPFGNTRSVLGVYKVLAVLRRLVKWIEEVFRPWAVETFH